MRIDPNVPRKGSILNERLYLRSDNFSEFPLFSLFELDITDLCNRYCEFCPRINKELFPNRGEFMSMKLYAKLLRELNELEYNGILAYSGFSEPLLHPKIYEMISASRMNCPKARI